MHKDVATAWNVLTFASTENGEAIWVMFSRKDSGMVAEWIQRQSGCKGNAIHHQQTHLTSEDLADLWEEQKIRPYIIHQRLYQFVFIPAGCAHQVRPFVGYCIQLFYTLLIFQVSNQADCIKVACDIIPPWSLHECLKLAEEFRAENLIDDPWMTDVVQTKLTALHAYMNVQSQLARLHSTMEVNSLSDEGDCASSPVVTLEDSPGPESGSPADNNDFVPGMELIQRGDNGILDKREKNRRNREAKKASRHAKESEKTNEAFDCPWCSQRGGSSVSILKHMYVFREPLLFILFSDNKLL